MRVAASCARGKTSTQRPTVRGKPPSDDTLFCLDCKGEKIDKRSLQTCELFFCNGACQREWPDYHFARPMLRDWQAKETLFLARCSRCVVREKKVEAAERFTCNTCEEEKHVSELSAPKLSAWLSSA